MSTTDNIERIERIVGDRELLESLDPADLVAAGNVAHKTALRWWAVDRKLQDAIRAEAGATGAAIILGGDVDAEIVTPMGPYKWDMDALNQHVRPLLGEAAWADVVEEVPHVCPPPAHKVSAVKLKTLLRKLGKPGEGLFELCSSREPGAPKVEYKERAE